MTNGRWTLSLVAALMVQGCGSPSPATPDAGPIDLGPPFDWTNEALPPEAMGCGDGILEQGESCEDANDNAADGCDACAWTALCGDGVTEGNEACDDGNRVNGDGCRASCEIEVCGDRRVDAPAEACDGSGTCAECAPGAGCGDGELAANEGCDDGNTASWDGCSSACTTESVYLLNDLEFLTLSSSGCDFNGVGAPQNAVGRALGTVAGAWNAYLDGEFRDAEQRPVFAVSGFNPAVADSLFRVGLVDATLTDPSLQQVTPAAGNFDYAHARLVGDRMVSDPTAIRLLAGGAVIIDQPLQRAQFRVRAFPDVVAPNRIEAILCGVSEASALATAQDLFASPGPAATVTCGPVDRLVSMTDLFAGGRRLGFVGVPVDVDLDGDGLETLIVEGVPTDPCVPVVVGCVEGDGTVINDPNCVFDFDDGWSMAIGFGASRASFVTP